MRISLIAGYRGLGQRVNAPSDARDGGEADNYRPQRVGKMKRPEDTESEDKQAWHYDIHFQCELQNGKYQRTKIIKHSTPPFTRLTLLRLTSSTAGRDCDIHHAGVGRTGYVRK